MNQRAGKKIRIKSYEKLIFFYPHLGSETWRIGCQDKISSQDQLLILLLVYKWDVT